MKIIIIHHIVEADLCFSLRPDDLVVPKVNST